MFRSLMTGCVISIMAVTSVVAQDFHDEEFVTDRPQITDSARIVPLKTVQIETGFEYVKDGDVRIRTWPNTLLRFGIHPKYELRIETPGWSRSSDDQSTHFNDIAVGTKMQIGNRDAEHPLALIFMANLPTGSDAVSAGRPEYSLSLAHCFNGISGTEVLYNLGVASVVDDDDRQWLLFGSVNYEYGFNDRWAHYLEASTEVPEKGIWEPVLSTGLIYQTGASSELDLSVSAGLNSAAPDLILRAGFSILY